MCDALFRCGALVLSPADTALTGSHCAVPPGPFRRPAMRLAARLFVVVVGLLSAGVAAAGIGTGGATRAADNTATTAASASFPSLHPQSRWQLIEAPEQQQRHCFQIALKHGQKQRNTPMHDELSATAAVAAGFESLPRRLRRNTAFVSPSVSAPIRRDNRIQVACVHSSW